MPSKADEARARIAALEKNPKHNTMPPGLLAQQLKDDLNDPAQNDPNATVDPKWRKFGDVWVNPDLPEVD